MELVDALEIIYTLAMSSNDSIAGEVAEIANKALNEYYGIYDYNDHPPLT